MSPRKLKIRYGEGGRWFHTAFQTRMTKSCCYLALMETLIYGHILNIRDNYAFQENIFYEWLLWTWILDIEISHTGRNHGHVLHLFHRHLQTFTQGRVMLKNNIVYFLAIYANFPCKTEKFKLEVVSVDFLKIRFYFQGGH